MTLVKNCVWFADASRIRNKRYPSAVEIRRRNIAFRE